MRKAERLFEIIQILRRAKQPVSAQSIGDELGVSKRSVYRDISALISQGVPVIGEAGVGYILEDHFHMPPLTLTQDEIDAAVLGALWVSQRAEPTLAKAAENLIAKIEAVTPEDLRPNILSPVSSVAPKSTRLNAADAVDLRGAIRSKSKLKLTYMSDKGEQTHRIVWPILIGYRDIGRILAAWCESREGFRYFRTDRMVSVEVLDEQYPERRDLLKRRWKLAMDEERKQYQ